MTTRELRQVPESTRVLCTTKATGDDPWTASTQFTSMTDAFDAFTNQYPNDEVTLCQRPS